MDAGATDTTDWTVQTEGDLLAVVDDYDELLGAMRERREALGLSQMDLDEATGWAMGYTGKLECDPRAQVAKVLGRQSLPLILAALGLRLAVIARPVPPITVTVAQRATNRRRELQERMQRNAGRLTHKQRRELATATVDKRWAKVRMLKGSSDE
ncbi:hypothetical protein SLNSH_17040 [Alsobacter soli]|uniref:Uncharacterized protein n=1 Tax=Alsobacter soli TaxID=2109933 RepID=A0A2T1HQ88_9HYPH|nr:hypothetical protein [Alsobacter soli]PSC03815.1 hypothetical protein SLNSH_17040 [Alsobacter soli]